MFPGNFSRKRFLYKNTRCIQPLYATTIVSIPYGNYALSTNFILFGEK